MAFSLAEKMASATPYLDRSFLLHDVYRTLLENGRTYAAFEVERTLPLVKALSNRETIFDPMAGYGTLMSMCASIPGNVNTVNIECNIPSFYWQVLMNPTNATIFMNLCDLMLERINIVVDLHLRAVCSDTWYSEESLIILKSIWENVRESVNLICSEDVVDDFAVAFMLPFVGRLASFVHGNVVTHVKEGGICVYHGWKKDFCAYASYLRKVLAMRSSIYNNGKHVNILADARTVDLREAFPAMITSPPYPNGTDYARIFAPENAWIRWMTDQRYITKDFLRSRLIGSPIVSAVGNIRKMTIDDLTSESAIKFIEALSRFRGSKKAEYDNKVYYIPYFCKYFHDIEVAYANISRMAAHDFTGYIVVVNNTARKIIIPVAEAIVDIWTSLGFKAHIDNTYTREVSHVGGINPDVKGISARHIEYVIKVSRNG